MHMMIGTKLKDLRMAKGMTQAELAERVGIDRSMISKIEAGEKINPTIGVLERMATELGASIEVFTAEEQCA
jgi:transcriptional regulator with XRE-family HTH domain